MSPTEAGRPAIPVEIIRVRGLTPAPKRGAARRSEKAASPARGASPEAAEPRRLAGALADWLRGDADPEARRAALGGLAPAQEAPMRQSPTWETPTWETPTREARSPAAPAPLVEEPPLEPVAPAIPLAPALDPEAEPLVTQADSLALRIALFGGEISEQRYGPERRWVVLDGHGAALETPEAAVVAWLIEAGRLKLNRFERGAAVWRLTPKAGAPGPAAYRQGPAEAI